MPPAAAPSRVRAGCASSARAACQRVPIAGRRPVDARGHGHHRDARHGLRGPCGHQPQRRGDRHRRVEQRQRQHADGKQQAADRVDSGPATGASYTSPATIPITATAGDVDGRSLASTSTRARSSSAPSSAVPFSTRGAVSPPERTT